MLSIKFLTIIAVLCSVTNTGSVGEDMWDVVLLVETSEEVGLRPHSVHRHILPRVVTGALGRGRHEPVGLVAHVVLADVVSVPVTPRLFVAWPSPVHDRAVEKTVRPVASQAEDVLASVRVAVDGHGVGVVGRHDDQSLLCVDQLQGSSHGRVQLESLVYGLPGLVPVMAVVHQPRLNEDHKALGFGAQHLDGFLRHESQGGVVKLRSLLQVVLHVLDGEQPHEVVHSVVSEVLQSSARREIFIAGPGRLPVVHPLLDQVSSVGPEAVPLVLGIRKRLVIEISPA